MVQIIDVIVNTDTLEVNSVSGNVRGAICFRVGDEAFPDEAWDDFPVVVLGWWIKELSQLKGQHETFKLDFMDGPLYAKGILQENNTAEIEFTKERVQQNEIFCTAICDIDQLKLSIHNAARNLSQELDRKGVCNEDIKKLKLLTA